MKIKYLLILIGIPLLIVVCLVFSNDATFNQQKVVTLGNITERSVETGKLLPPTNKIDITKSYNAILHTTEGDITIKLAVLDAPAMSTNFIYLSKVGFYNKTIFHRVVNGFMIQGGDPNGDGTGGPGYLLSDEPFDGEYTRGTVAMANSGPNTNGSQFFIMQQDKYDLPKNYIIFGKVTSGMDVVDKIASGQVTDNGRGENSKPVNPVVINSVEITEGP